MRKAILGLILAVAMVAGSAGMLWAVPIVNTTQFLTGTSTLYSYWKNSGDWIFTSVGNNDGTPNLPIVEAEIETVLHLPSTFVLTPTNNVIFTMQSDRKSGTWATIPPVDAISFYAVKAGNAYAMYRVDPAEGTGSWSTFDIYLSGLQGTGGPNGVAISHFTGYNPAGSPVPEPATLLLLGTGLVGLASFGRKKLLTTK